MWNKKYFNISISSGTLKMSRGDYIIYNRKWLYENLDTEFEHLKEAKALNKKIAKVDAKAIRKEIDRILKEGEK